MAAAVEKLSGLQRSAGTNQPAKSKSKATKESKPEAKQEDRTYDLAQLFTHFVFIILGGIVLGALTVIVISL